MGVESGGLSNSYPICPKGYDCHSPGERMKEHIVILAGDTCGQKKLTYHVRDSCDYLCALLLAGLDDIE